MRSGGRVGLHRGESSRIRRGDPDGIQALSHDPAKKAARAQRTAELKDMLYELALHSEHEMVQLRASEALLDRLEGRPVPRKVSTSADMDMRPPGPGDQRTRRR
jgi:hypothetical protein